MKLVLALVFALCIFSVACSQPQPSPASLIPTAIAAPSATTAPTATVTPTITPFPTRTPIPLKDLYQFNSNLITEPEFAIPYSHNLLMMRGYEQGFSYDNALFTPVEFPDGAKGAFVALGFGGPAHGYTLLYRIETQDVFRTFRLIQLEDSIYDWGMDFGNREATFDTKVELSFPELVFDAKGKPEHLIELTGSSHQGTGLWNSGYFEIFKVTNTGTKAIFRDTHFQASFNHLGEYNSYKYAYTDLSGDRNKEIIKSGTECTLFINADNKSDCKNVRDIYEYNGVEYVKQP